MNRLQYALAPTRVHTGIQALSNIGIVSYGGFSNIKTSLDLGERTFNIFSWLNQNSVHHNPYLRERQVAAAH